MLSGIDQNGIPNIGPDIRWIRHVVIPFRFLYPVFRFAVNTVRYVTLRFISPQRRPNSSRPPWYRTRCLPYCSSNSSSLRGPFHVLRLSGSAPEIAHRGSGRQVSMWSSPSTHTTPPAASSSGPASLSDSQPATVVVSRSFPESTAIEVLR